MYFGRQLLRQDFEPMYIKTGSGSDERVEAAKKSIPSQRSFKDLTDYASENATALPHVFIVGLESDPTKLHRTPGLLAKGPSGIIVQHQKATRNANIGGLNKWRSGFTPEMLNAEERTLVGMHLIEDESKWEDAFEDGTGWFDEENNAWTLGEPFVILDASSVGLDIPITFTDKVEIARNAPEWEVLGTMTDLDELEKNDPTRFKALVLMVYKNNK
jgi:hypothetical protein